ncbi:MAG: succinylglutamate desuccinylase, partial [Pseudomonadota bacterium]|nr:succinylglutamate desuccinylase [Pseudomonadota bacterium]
LTQEGEAVYHIAYFSEPDTVAEHVELLQDNLLPPEQGPVL